MGRKKEQIAWQRVALNIAKDEHENNFASRRGLGSIQSVGFYYYDNNPDEHRPGVLAAFRAWLRQEPDVSELSIASYPVGGPDDGYTTAMIIAGPPDAEEKIRQALARCIER
jgi:hypothetical protein